MGMFDFFTYSGEAAADVVDLTHKIAARTAVDAVPGIDVGKLASVLFSTPAISGTSDTRGTIPDGWREVDPREMGFTENQIGYNDYIKVDSPILGDADGTVQYKVFQSDGGQLAISWAATNNPLDIVDYFKLNESTVLPYMDESLTTVAAYAQGQGMSAADVLVTGYSLGGAYTVIMAEGQKTLAGGFFDQATYVSHDGPKVNEGIPNLLHYGSENDIVYRAIGDFPTFDDALDAAGPLLEGSDFNFESSIDNVIVYDGAFNSPLFPFAPFSILNILGGWYNHITNGVTDAVQRIGDSAYYDLTNEDSAVVVSALGADLRGLTWVVDKSTHASNDHFGRSAHIIGTHFDDRLHDGASNDFVSGLGGDDLMRVTGGMDMVDGGVGTDTLRLGGKHRDWDVYRMEDGTLAFESDDGLVFAENVERIEFEGLTIGRESIINDSYVVESNELHAEGSWFKRLFKSDIRYDSATEGSDGDDVLSGATVFGRDGDDVITGTKKRDLLSGDDGKDTLSGGKGADKLYGGAQDDILISDGGDDLLNGGHGTDVFVFNEESRGTVKVEDFNRAMGEFDILHFADHAGSVEDVYNAATESRDGVTLQFDGLAIDLEMATLAMLTEETLSFA